MINQIIHLFFILVLLLVILFYGAIIYAARRAARQTKIPIPMVWQKLMFGCIIIIVGSLIFMLLVSP